MKWFTTSWTHSTICPRSSDLFYIVSYYMKWFTTICPGSSDQFSIVSYHIKWVTTSWTYSIFYTFGIISFYFRMESVDQALQNMKASLRSLRSETEVSSSSLEDVLSTMKDTLSSIKTEVNHKTLLDLNREMTPFDLPALSPVPQVHPPTPNHSLSGPLIGQLLPFDPLFV